MIFSNADAYMGLPPPKVWTKCDFYENRLFLEKYQKNHKKLYFWGPRAPQKITGDPRGAKIHQNIQKYIKI